VSFLLERACRRHAGFLSRTLTGRGLRAAAGRKCRCRSCGRRRACRSTGKVVLDRRETGTRSIRRRRAHGISNSRTLANDATKGVMLLLLYIRTAAASRNTLTDRADKKMAEVAPGAWGNLYFAEQTPRLMGLLYAKCLSTTHADLIDGHSTSSISPAPPSMVTSWAICATTVGSTCLSGSSFTS